MEVVIGLLAVVVFSDFSDSASLDVLTQRMQEDGAARHLLPQIWRDCAVALSNRISDEIGMPIQDRRDLQTIIEDMLSQWRMISESDLNESIIFMSKLREFYVARWRGRHGHLADMDAVAPAMSISFLGDKIRNILLTAGIDSLSDLRLLPPHKIRSIPGIGSERLRIIEGYLQRDPDLQPS